MPQVASPGQNFGVFWPRKFYRGEIFKICCGRSKGNMAVNVCAKFCGDRLCINKAFSKLTAEEQQQLKQRSGTRNKNFSQVVYQ